MTDNGPLHGRICAAHEIVTHDAFALHKHVMKPYLSLLFNGV